MCRINILRNVKYTHRSGSAQSLLANLMVNWPRLQKDVLTQCCPPACNGRSWWNEDLIRLLEVGILYTSNLILTPIYSNPVSSDVGI